MMGLIISGAISIFGVLFIFLIDKLYMKYSIKINNIRDYFDIVDKKEIVNNILKFADTTGYNDEDDFIDDLIFKMVDVIYHKMIKENFKITYTQVEIVVFEKLNDSENYFIEDEFMKFFYENK